MGSYGTQVGPYSGGGGIGSYTRTYTSVDTACGALLRQLQHMWDEIGETDEERDAMLVRLEEECMNVYRRTVEESNRKRVLLAQAATDAEAEVVSLCAKLGEPYVAVEYRSGTLRDQLAAFKPHLENLRGKKEERIKKFGEIQKQIAALEADLDGRVYDEAEAGNWQVAIEADLTFQRLEDLHGHFEDLQKEKSERLTRVLELAKAVHELCAVLGLDFHETIMAIHPSLIDMNAGHTAKSVSPDTLKQLREAVHELIEEKRQRIVKISSCGAKIVELWTLLETSEDERIPFMELVQYINAAEEDVQEPDILSASMITQAEVEVERLESVKGSRMKELVRNKRALLEAICHEAHFPPPENTAEEKTSAIIEAGLVDPQELLSTIEAQIVAAKEEAQSRKDLMKEINKWKVACEEEEWLEKYNQDPSRFNSRGAHLNRSRAEKARGMINRIPELIEKVTNAVRTWEREHKKSFYFDGRRVTDMLADYKDTMVRNEEAKKRQREEALAKKKQTAEREAQFGSKPVRSAAKKTDAPKTVGSSPQTPQRRLSLGGAHSPDGGHHNTRTPQNGPSPSRTPGTATRDKGKPSRLSRTPGQIVPPNVVALQNNGPPSADRQRFTGGDFQDNASTPVTRPPLYPMSEAVLLNGKEGYDVHHYDVGMNGGLNPAKLYNHQDPHGFHNNYSDFSENLFLPMGEEFGSDNGRRATLAFGDQPRGNQWGAGR